MGAGRIKLIVTDVDGVWTDGRIVYAGSEQEIKNFNVRDGLGVKLAQKAGIEVAVLTSRTSSAVQRRCAELGITDVRQGAANKLDAVKEMLGERNLTFEQLCYVGDDLPDLAPINNAAISAAPSDAAAEVTAAVRWKLEARGGHGAFRELVERLLRARGEWDAIVESFHGAKITAENV
ncbi:MAG: HAD-IIIA family hydrolase [Thermoanaerobaculia bacterium]|jgi:3-deoxy-D-manno-octulosonate 8-phosphate phosphatase (KDO 8-P phosphatase)